MLQGDILFMRMSKDPVRVGDILSFTVDFGGSSVSSVDRMKEVVELILSFLEENPVIVLSAMGKTTKKLIAAGEKATSCISDVSENQ
ncbi:putative aspartate kinase [Helianthus anomalus]